MIWNGFCIETHNTDRPTIRRQNQPDGGMNTSKIANNLVKRVRDGEMVTVESLWKEEGCLDAKRIRLIGIGLEELGVEEFVKGKFLDGDLYIDSKQQCYKDLGYKRMGFFQLLPAVFSRKSRNAAAQARKEQLGGNIKGDAMQNGGLLVVNVGGKVLLSYKQEDAADHEDPNNVLKALVKRAVSDHNLKFEIPTLHQETPISIDTNDSRCY
ncbi:hypothetical protein ScPMuIL_008215 [Solemya velum]